METKERSFFLFIEPKGPCSAEPIIDKYTRKMTGALRKADVGQSAYGEELPLFLADIAHKGKQHVCICGAESSDKDYLIRTKEMSSVYLFRQSVWFHEKRTEFASEEIRGIITNPLCVHYLAYHRNEIPQDQLDRIVLFEGEEADPTAEELQHKVKESEPTKETQSS